MTRDTCALLAALDRADAGASSSPMLTGALDTLMRAYMPCAGAPQPPTYADWIPASRSWPPELALLHSACVDARRAWAQATDVWTATQEAGQGAGEDRAAGIAATLAGVAYYAIEGATRAAIAAWARERLAAGELAGAGAQEARKWIEGPTGEEEEGPLW